jgi:hypothetical protein
MSNEQSKVVDLSNLELCQRFAVECRIVGDVYGVDQQGSPIPEADLKKWMVTTPAGAFPRALIESLPPAASEKECEALAVEYLMLRERGSFLNQGSRQLSGAEKKSPAIPTAVYMVFIKDGTYWPCTDSAMVYATDVVLEVDGKRYQQDELEPATFAGTSEVVIVDGTVFEEWTALHSMHEHFERWITGHQPKPHKHNENT